MLVRLYSNCHIGGGTSEAKDIRFHETKEILGNERLKEQNFLLARNRIYVIIKNMPLVLILIYLPYIIGGLIMNFSYHLLLKPSHIKQFLSGVFRGIMDIPRLLSKRKLVQAHKKLSIREIDRLIKFCTKEESE